MNDDTTIKLGDKFGSDQTEKIVLTCQDVKDILARYKKNEAVSNEEFTLAFKHVLECPECNPNIQD